MMFPSPVAPVAAVLANVVVARDVVVDIMVVGVGVEIALVREDVGDVVVVVVVVVIVIVGVVELGVIVGLVVADREELVTYIVTDVVVAGVVTRMEDEVVLVVTVIKDEARTVEVEGEPTPTVNTRQRVTTVLWRTSTERYRVFPMPALPDVMLESQFGRTAEVAVVVVKAAGDVIDGDIIDVNLNVVGLDWNALAEEEIL